MFSFLTNEPGKESWPITGATFILMQQKPENPARNNEVLKFFDWAYGRHPPPPGRAREVTAQPGRISGA